MDYLKSILDLLHPQSQPRKRTMASLPHIIFLHALLFLFIKPIFPQQFYDKTNCSADSQVPGSNYLCTPQISQCKAYIAYRAQQGFQTLPSISRLFGLNPYDHDLFTLNHINEAESNISLHLGREVIIPINCSCPDRFSRAIIKYELSPLDSLEKVACGVFQGLAKAQSVVEENPELGGVIKVPIRCACPGDDQRRNGVKFMVTYPVMSNDYVDLIGKIFGVSDQSIMEANRLSSPFSAIFPYTTLLVPTTDRPVLNLNVAASPQHPPPSPRDVIAVKKGKKPTNLKLNQLLALSALAATLVLAALACFLCLRFRRNRRHTRFQPLSPRSSKMSNFTRDFLDGMSKLKHSLISFSYEDLRIATEGFSASSVIGSGVHRGRMGSAYVAIEEMSSGEAARHVVDILTKINHQNVVKLEGYCCDAKNYLILEFAGNGSLRDCLRSKIAWKLTWKIRMQIALDLAVGLHYVHHCIKPSYVHRNISSKTVLITTDWRAKISGFGLAKPMVSGEDKEEAKWVDVFSFGVILIELISGKDASEQGELLSDFLRFLSDIGLEGSPGSLQKLNEFVDGVMGGVFELADIICLAFLAKACVDNDPHNRPTMNDVLKALSRIA